MCTESYAHRIFSVLNIFEIRNSDPCSLLPYINTDTTYNGLPTYWWCFFRLPRVQRVQTQIRFEIKYYTSLSFANRIDLRWNESSLPALTSLSHADRFIYVVAFFLIIRMSVWLKCMAWTMGYTGGNQPAARSFNRPANEPLRLLHTRLMVLYSGGSWCVYVRNLSLCRVFISLLEKNISSTGSSITIHAMPCHHTPSTIRVHCERSLTLTFSLSNFIRFESPPNAPCHCVAETAETKQYFEKANRKKQKKNTHTQYPTKIVQTTLVDDVPYSFFSLVETRERTGKRQIQRGKNNSVSERLCMQETGTHHFGLCVNGRNPILCIHEYIASRILRARTVGRDHLSC